MRKSRKKRGEVEKWRGMIKVAGQNKGGGKSRRRME